MHAIACRLHVDETLAAGAAVGLDAPRAHYLRHVLRLDAGATVALFNARDGEWAARIDGFGKGWCSLVVADRRRVPAPEPDLWLLFAPIKRARIDFLVQKATELGASVVWPVFTRRTAMARVNLARLTANAVEAAEQCERLSVPELRADATLEAAVAAWPAERRLLVCAEAGAARPIAATLADIDPTVPLGVLVGPEGGWAPEELSWLLGHPFVLPVGLGPRILRADTAALAALAVVQALRGDGAGRPVDRGAAAPRCDPD
ncbi:MAG: 16S rRNA (uracil(1498)-N(3))-methyltransferase [Alphaproteobacteria bacterium]|nr:16S rRNA (uracil(1498)-N(3))-methyltransferase [Alphaproteobacteria bacterium]